MANSILSIFIDEIGNFNMKDSHGFLYGFTLVFHDREHSITKNLEILSTNLELQNLPSEFVIHTAPLIRKKDQYAEMERQERRKIFVSFFNFAKRLPINYKSFIFYKPDFETKEQMLNLMSKSLGEFIMSKLSYFHSFNKIIVLYDNGQREIAQLLRVAFSSHLNDVEFKLAMPTDYRLLQVADMICTLEATEEKRKRNKVSKSELDFFKTMHNFKTTFYKGIKKLETKL